MISRRTTGVLTLALAIASGGLAPSRGDSTTQTLKTTPCRIGQSHAQALCGTLTVFEDRNARAGRTIRISFISIKAKHPSHQAVAFNPGGPGVSATAMANDFADVSGGAFAALRDRYDILLVDNRGTGHSAPLQCEFAPVAHPELAFAQTWPDALVTACRDRLAAHANLSMYSSDPAADDLDDVRAALGYPKLVLYGGSYGTYFYLVYARRHPERVESMVLEGVAPPYFYRIPLPMARGAQTALNGLQVACRRDATCSSHFPAFDEHFDAVLHRFDAGPISMTLPRGSTRRDQRVELSKEVFVEAIRHVMYGAGEAFIPVTIERAYRGDYRPLAEMVDQQSQLFADLQANGLNLSVSCVEDIPFITEADVVRESAGSFEGDARVRAQQRACRLWNVTPAAASFNQPIRSTAPTLMISGSDDPATPPQYGREALRYLPNARQMVVPGASHDSDYPPCVDATILAFVRARSAAGLKFNNCAAAFHRPSFAMLAFDESGPNENRGLTNRVRAVVSEILHGRIDRSQLTPTASKHLPDPLIKALAADMADAGTLQNVAYKSVHTTSGGTVYTYLLRFSRANALATITLDSSARIAALDISGA